MSKCERLTEQNNSTLWVIHGQPLQTCHERTVGSNVSNQIITTQTTEIHKQDNVHVHCLEKSLSIFLEKEKYMQTVLNLNWKHGFPGNNHWNGFLVKVFCKCSNTRQTQWLTVQHPLSFTLKNIKLIKKTLYLSTSSQLFENRCIYILRWGYVIHFTMRLCDTFYDAAMWYIF